MRKKAFTLTELLLAVAIVGVIAALVLPALMSKFNEKALDLGFEREVKTISTAIDSLAVTENEKDFFSTIMYADEEPEHFDDTSGKFLKKYLRVSKYCGDSFPQNCFAPEYYEYQNNEKVIYTPNLTGACAMLKNGMSICITPQIGAQGVLGVLDLNGKKGPNILGRDLRFFSLDSKTRSGKVSDSTEVLAHNGYIDLGNEVLPPESPIIPPANACANDDYSLDCCRTRAITDSSDPCCSYDEIKNGNGNCDEIVNITLKCISEAWSSSSADFYSRGILCKTSINPYSNGFQTSNGANKYSIGQTFNFRQSCYKMQNCSDTFDYRIWYNGNQIFNQRIDSNQWKNYNMKYNITRNIVLEYK